MSSAQESPNTTKERSGNTDSLRQEPADVSSVQPIPPKVSDMAEFGRPLCLAIVFRIIIRLMPLVGRWFPKNLDASIIETFRALVDDLKVAVESDGVLQRRTLTLVFRLHRKTFSYHDEAAAFGNWMLDALRVAEADCMNPSELTDTVVARVPKLLPTEQRASLIGAIRHDVRSILRYAIFSAATDQISRKSEWNEPLWPNGAPEGLPENLTNVHIPSKLRLPVSLMRPELPPLFRPPVTALADHESTSKLTLIRNEIDRLHSRLKDTLERSSNDSPAIHRQLQEISEAAISLANLASNAPPKSGSETNDTQVANETILEVSDMEADTIMDQLLSWEAQFVESNNWATGNVQHFLDRLSGANGFGSFEANTSICKQVTELARRIGVRLMYKDQPASIRCVKPKRSRIGSFQVRRTANGLKVLYTGTKWPSLRVFPDSSS